MRPEHTLQLEAEYICADYVSFTCSRLQTVGGPYIPAITGGLGIRDGVETAMQRISEAQLQMSREPIKARQQRFGQERD